MQLQEVMISEIRGQEFFRTSCQSSRYNWLRPG